MPCSQTTNGTEQLANPSWARVPLQLYTIDERFYHLTKYSGHEYESRPFGVVQPASQSVVDTFGCYFQQHD